MESALYLVGLAIAAMMIINAIRQRPLPSSGGDWLVALDVDAAKKVVLVHSLPILAFRQATSGVAPIVSAEGFVDALARRRPAKVEGQGGHDVSGVFTYWLRDGAIWDVHGPPVDASAATLRGVLMEYLLSDFKVFGAGSVPAVVSAEITAGHELFSQWEFKALGGHAKA